MPTSNTVIIFQKPELYFFPHYKNLVYAPFSVPEGSLRYYLYRFLHLLRLPGYSHFWGAWKEQLSSAEQVIIFDYGYQRGMEKALELLRPCGVLLDICQEGQTALTISCCCPKTAHLPTHRTFGIFWRSPLSLIPRRYWILTASSIGKRSFSTAPPAASAEGLNICCAAPRCGWL